jgi:hypothetical protein
LHWADKPFITLFYQRLKEKVKNKFSKTDKPDTLAKYIEIAVKIDRRFFEKRVEKKRNITAKKRTG